jgi:hypothetical protein
MSKSSGKKVKIIGLLAAGIVLLFMLGLVYYAQKNPSIDPSASNTIRSSETDHMVASLQEKQSRESAGVNKKPSIEDRLVNELKKYYGSTISQKSTQAKLLKVKAFVSQLYPKDGDKRFYAILKKAFPDLADEIISVLFKMEKYKNWLADNAHVLSDMSKLEKEGLVWEKRKEFLGADAEEIWSEEVVAFEKKKIEMRETLSYLDKADDLTIYEKLAEYESTLKDVYEDSPEAFVLQNKSLHAKVFFSIESVQNELKQMEPDQRQMEINNIRREMGFTQQDVERMEEVDAYREKRWENGLAYMIEREGLSKEYEGAKLETQLDAMREKYFKHEAKTIKFEEEDGFFRFKRPRIYGRN